MSASGEDEAEAAPGTARSVYELRVVNPTSTERHKTFAIEMLNHVLDGFKNPAGGSLATLHLELINRRTGDVVLTMNDVYDGWPGVAQSINADLDRLSAADFATEWGIGPGSHS